MVELRLVGLSEDRQRLILAGPSGQEFSVAVDDRLRAALRGDRARLGQLEIQMDSALRPRDIQARIRAGETPDAVAEVAQVPVDKIMGYAVPVLAEREHMAERAQRSTVRRKGSEGPGRLLGDAVAEQLRSRNVDPGTATWDAWRREDGKWTVTVTHTGHQKPRVATFTFDPLGRYALADDDDARWLIGDATTKPRSAKAGSGKGKAKTRRLTAVASEPDDDDRLFADDDDDVLFADDDEDLTAVADAVRSSPDEETPTDTEGQDETPRADSARADSARADSARADSARADSARAGAQPDDAPDEDAEEEPPGARRRVRKTRGRASVPSWDEIMFGRTKE